MAERWAVATGNWSATGTWNGGTLPGSGDDVHANTFTVTIDQDVTVNSLRNTAGTTPAAGGVFTNTTGTRTLTLAGGIVTGTVDCLTISGGTVTIAGGGTITGGTAAGADAVVVSSTAAVTINNPITGGTNSTGNGVLWTGTGSLTIGGGLTLTGATSAAISRTTGTTGTLTIGASGNPCTLSGSTSTTCVSVTTAVTTSTIYANSGTLSGTGAGLTWGTSATATVTGNFTGQTGVGMLISSTGTVNLTGNFTGSSTSTTGYGISVTGGCTLTVTGTGTAGTQGHGLNIATTTAATIVVDEVVGNSRGIGSTDLIAFAIAHASLPTTGTVKVKTATCGPNGAWPISGPAFIQTLSSGAVKVRDSTLTQATYQQSSGGGAVPQFKRQPIMAGDYRKGDTVYIITTTMGTSGPTTASGLTLACYEDGTATAITAGVTTVFSGGFHSMAGCVSVAIDTSNAAYTAGKNYAVVATAGTVSGSSIVGDVLGRFSVQKESRSALSTLDPVSGVTTNATLQTISGYIDTEVATLVTQTGAAAIRTALGLGSANLDTQLTNIYGAVDTETSAGAIRTALGLATANLDTQLSTIAGYIDAEVGTVITQTSASSIRSAVGLSAANLDTTLNNIYGAVDTETSAGAIRTALGMSAANLDTQITNIPKNVWLYDFLAALPQTVPRYSPWSAMRTIMRWFVTSSTTKRVYKEDGTTAFDTTITNDGAGGITGDDKP